MLAVQAAKRAVVRVENNEETTILKSVPINVAATSISTRVCPDLRNRRKLVYTQRHDRAGRVEEELTVGLAFIMLHTTALRVKRKQE